MKKIALLLVVASIVTLFMVSCSKDDSTSSTPAFSMTTDFSLDFNAGSFSGKFKNASGLTSMALLLKKDGLDYERYEIDFNNSGFQLTIKNLDFTTYSYHYEYVTSGTTKTTSEKTFSVLVGRWKTDVEEPWFEVYNPDGTGKQWDTADDVHEDEADTFEWYFEGRVLNKTIHFQQTGNIVFRAYDITTLSDTRLEYNNDNFKESVSLIRVN